jgi:hypothetical protein
MYIPSTDFQLFSLPQFGGLFSDSLGLSNSFQSSDPSNYVNYALNSFAQILKPQTPTQIPSQPNYGAGIELGNVGDLFTPLPLITPQFPSFQGQDTQTLDDLRRRLQKVRDDAQAKLDETYGKTSSQGGNTTTVNVNTQPPRQNRNVLGGSIPIWSKDAPMVSDGSGSGKDRVIGDDPTKSGDKAQTVADFFKTLPAGSGIFLIAIAIIILILLFARGK